MKTKISVSVNEEEVNLYNVEPEHVWNSFWFDVDDIVFAYETQNNDEEGIRIYLKCEEEFILQKSDEIIAMLDKKFNR